MKHLVLGIDTGGTHTDAVILDPGTGAVLVSAKAETTHYDLAVGITEAMRALVDGVDAATVQTVGRINLSTTLATNAIAEGLSGRVGLILMGYDSDQEAVRGLTSTLPSAETVFVGGSHDYYGLENEPLNETAIVRAAEEMNPRVAGWAVSGFFSVKNPEHELRAADLLAKYGKPVTLGRDLTGEYDAIRRASTAALNAGLVVIINRLLDAVKSSAAKVGLIANLMVVKGDGSLVSEDWAREKPIETVVSGPAASLVGARILGRGFLEPHQKDLWVLDVGGTTTDMALVEDGRPKVNPNGARVGQWNTMTVAVETRTRGLGGDSLVTLDRYGRVTIGPRRVLPLCRLVDRWPNALQTLKTQKIQGVPATQAAYFFVPGAPPDPGLNDDEASILEALKTKTPLALAEHAEKSFQAGHRFSGLQGLKHPSVLISSFTPTDAMAIIGLYNQGKREAAVLGAAIIGRAARLSPEEVAARILDEFGRLLATEIICHGFDGGGLKYLPEEFGDDGVFGGTMGRRAYGRIRVEVAVDDPIMFLGAPAQVLAPFMAKYIKGRVIVPPVYDAAGAAGAAASPVYLRRRVEIHGLPNFSGYRLFLPDGMVDGENIDELAAIAQARMESYMYKLAALAGAGRAAVACRREDHRVRLNGGDAMHLGATLNFIVTEKKSAAN